MAPVLPSPPLGPELLHYMTILFRAIFPDYLLLFASQNWYYFLGYVKSCVVAKHAMWTSDYIAYLFNYFASYVICICITELVWNELCNDSGLNGN